MKHNNFIFFKQFRLPDFLIVIFLVLSLLSVSFIFYNSSQNSSQSNDRSDKIVEKVQSIVDSEGKIEKKDFQKIVRKTAHALEFCALGISVGCLMLSIYSKYKQSYFGFSLFALLAVGVTDEFIQSFNDRTSKVSDVLIDFGGAVAGFILITGVTLLIYYLKNKNKKTQDIS